MSFSVIDSLKKTMLVPPHPEGRPFIAVGALVTLVLFVYTVHGGCLALALTLFCAYFFRDPARVTPQKSSLIIAPGDGVISAVTSGVSLPAEIGGDGGYTRISIFLSVLDVHVNRNPVTGRVVRKVYRPGTFLNADLDKASEDNERCSVLIERPDGAKIAVVQIAGLIARRIVNDLKEGQDVTAGARFGIIRFGSRVDVYMPGNIAALACAGQRAIGGETVLADMDGRETTRKGVVV